MIKILGPDGNPYVDATSSIATASGVSKYHDLLAGIKQSDDRTDIRSPMEGMRHPANFRCLEFISHAIGKTPLHVKKAASKGGSEVDANHAASYLLDGQANGLQTSYDAKYILAKIAAYYGNGVGYIVRDENAKPIALVPFLPGKFGIEIHGGKLRYSLFVRGEWHIGVPHTDIFHLWYWSVDGLIGLPWWQWHSRTLGLGLCAQDWAAKYYDGGAQPVTVLTYPPGLNRDPKSDEHKQYLESYKATLRKLGKEYRTMFIYDGQEVKELSHDAEKSQLHQSREMSGREVCMLYGLPPFVIGLDQSGPYKSTEEKSQLVIDALDPYFSRFENQSGSKLLTEKQKRNKSRSVHFHRDALKQIDSKAFVEILKTEVQSGLMTIGEARAEKNRPATGQEGEDKLWISGSLKPIESASSSMPDPTPMPTADEEAKEDVTDTDDSATGEEDSATEASEIALPHAAIADADRRAKAVIRQAFDRRNKAGAEAVLDLLSNPDGVLTRVARIYEPLGLLEHRTSFVRNTLLGLLDTRN